MRILFIGGTGKCGTTFTRDLLGLHPKIHAIPRETNPMYNPKWDRQWQREFQKAHRDGAEVIVEKTPSNALIARYLLAKHPGSLYLHVEHSDLHRQAVKLSEHAKFTIPKFGKFGGYEEARAYADFVHLRYMTVKSYVPHRVNRVRLVDFIDRPEPTVKFLMEFLGLPPIVHPNLKPKLETLDRGRLLGEKSGKCSRCNKEVGRRLKFWVAGPRPFFYCPDCAEKLDVLHDWVSRVWRGE